MKARIMAAALALAPFCAQAQTVPIPVTQDAPQMRRYPYDGKLMRLNLTKDRSVVLTFSPTEQVKRTVIGTSGLLRTPPAAEVQNTPLDNNLPIWPQAVGRTTLQVITAREGQPDRLYAFVVVVTDLPHKCGANGEPMPEGGVQSEYTRECNDDPDAVYSLTFTYPDDEKQAQAAAAREAAERRRAAAEANRARLEHAAALARLQQEFRCTNGDYWKRGTQAIVPDDACDDGRRIGLLYRGNRPIPAVLIIGPDGKERGIRVTQSGDWVIVPALWQKLVLRMGDAVVEVENRSFDPNGRNPGTGTGADDVIREVVQNGR